jgi:hypothetical protein
MQQSHSSSPQPQPKHGLVVVDSGFLTVEVALDEEEEVGRTWLTGSSRAEEVMAGSG